MAFLVPLYVLVFLFFSFYKRVRSRTKSNDVDEIPFIGKILLFSLVCTACIGFGYNVAAVYLTAIFLFVSDNDQILRTKNKMRLQRPSAMSIPTLAQSRQLEGRSTRTSTTKKPLKSIESKATTHTNDAKEKKGSSSSKVSISNVSKAKPGENKVATRANDVKEKNVSTLHVRVPVSDISKAKPCFMVT